MLTGRMRRSSRVRPSDLPRLALRVVVALAGFLGGRYGRIEGAHVLVRDDAGAVLVVRTTYLGPGWMLPGGRVERRESPHDAAARETREETGIAVRVRRLILADARRLGEVSFVFEGERIGGELLPELGEIAEVGWLTRDEIAASSPRLHRLLELCDRHEHDMAYLGLPGDR